MDPRVQLESYVKMTLTQLLEEKQGKILEKIVEEALKKKDYYGSKSLLQEQLDFAIADFVREIVKDIVKERREQIISAVKAKIDDTFFDRFCDTLSISLVKNLKFEFRVSE